MNTKRALKKLTTTQPDVPVTDNPIEELRRLVRQHRAAEKAKVKLHHMFADRKQLDPTTFKPVKDPVTKKPIVIPCRLPDTMRALLEKAHADTEDEMHVIERSMLRRLRSVPVYDVFLRHVYGVGPVLSAYLCAEVDIHKAVKISNLIRFCGMAVIDGKLERPKAGVKNSYNSLLRSKLYVVVTGMLRVAGKEPNADGLYTSSKYLKIWADKKNGLMQRAPAPDGAVMKPGAAHKAGWHCAARVLLEDLYVVWRTLEGLPVWPSYHAAKLGYSHGGKVCVDAPRMLTIDEALAIVGNVGKQYVGDRGWQAAEVTEEEDDDMIETDEESKQRLSRTKRRPQANGMKLECASIAE